MSTLESAAEVEDILSRIAAARLTQMTDSTARVGTSGDTPNSNLSLQAVLWDMDGTLVDSEPLWLEAEEQMLDQYGLTMSDEDRLALVGTGLWDAADLFRAMGVPLSADEIVEQWVGSVLAGFKRTGTVWRPGAREALASLSAAGIPCALVTMSVRSIAEWVVSQLPAGTFTVIVAGDEVEHAKPHPEPYLRGAAALGVSIESCIALEDSPKGLGAAMASGAVSVGIPNIVDLSAEQAHALWHSLIDKDAESFQASFTELRGRAALTHPH